MLTTVADAANADGKHAHPGVEGVMRGSLYSRRQAIMLLDELVQEGWLSIEEQGGGMGKATVYSLPRMAEANGAVVAPITVQSGAETVQFEGQTVQSGLHPNGLHNDKAQRSAKRSSFPEQFLLTAAMKEWAAENAPEVDLTFQTRQFADYWRGKGEKRADWIATWRMWIRNAQQWNRTGGRRGTPAPPADPVLMTEQFKTDEEYVAYMNKTYPGWDVQK